MPLPANDTAWPPHGEGPRYDRMRTYSVWYGGDPDALSALYMGTSGTTTEIIEGGVARRAVAAVRRFFWGTVAAVGEKATKIHVPVAQDIATMSSELLFSESPMVKVDGVFDENGKPDETTKKTQERLEAILDKTNWKALLLAAAETGSALGASGLRVAWDKEVVKDMPFISRVDADAILAEYRWGRLLAVTFWRNVKVDGQTYHRHLERHEIGKVYHGLYVGTLSNLGHIEPLADNPATAFLATQVNAEGYIPVPEYRMATSIPNMLPDPLDRANSVGRSDYTPGVITMMDAIDEIATSLMRDISLAKARLVIAQYMLEDNGAGKGASFNKDTEVFSPLKMQPGETGDAPITMVQFKIRVEEHIKAAEWFAVKALKSAGYNPDAEQTEGGAEMTATEVNSKRGKSMSTRDKKILYWQNPLEELLEALLAVDIAEFNTPGIKVFPVKVTWPPAVQPDMKVLAETANFMKQAEAASIRVRVEVLHPDWDDTQIDDEVKAIQKESGVADPNTFGQSPQPPAIPEVPGLPPAPELPVI